MPCVAYIGRPDAYPVGSFATYLDKCFSVSRAMDNGWIDPSQSWFWNQVDMSQCLSNGCGVSSSSVSFSSSSISVSSAFMDSSLVVQLKLLNAGLGSFVAFGWFAVGVVFAYVLFRQIKA